MMSSQEEYKNAQRNGKVHGLLFVAVQFLFGFVFGFIRGFFVAIWYVIKSLFPFFSGFAEAKKKRLKLEETFESHFGVHFRALLEKDAYIPYGEWNELLVSNSNLYNDARHHRKHLIQTTARNLNLFENAEYAIREHNRRFIELERKRKHEFFSSLAKYPLDEQQKECCIVDEDAGLVIAGAGSGKTSVIMAKVAYLVKERHVPPENILLISFTNKAADEMTERIANCLGSEDVSASTFHRFGLSVIKRYKSQQHDIADDAFLQRTIHELFCGDSQFTPEMYETVVNFLAFCINTEANGREDECLGDKIDREKRLDLKTLKSIILEQPDNITLRAEKVKSAEEVLIANYLFMNGVDYKYEMPYPKPYDDDGSHRKYHPDFYLPDFDVYLEHYGVDEHGDPPKYYPDIERRKYKESMQWKRRLHEEACNKYVESFSWWYANGVLFDNLKTSLEAQGVVFKPRDKREIYEYIKQKAGHKLGEVEKLLATFINLYKSNGFDVSHFDELLKKKASSASETIRQRNFLSMARDIYVRYEERLRESRIYDFADMINIASDVIAGLTPKTLKYTHIIVDEFQDASVARMKLLKAAIANSGAHLFCVGDDWQSIYRFAGSDVSLFTNFTEHFGYTAEMRIENTYRNSQELLDIMQRFVLKNKQQLRKRLHSSKHLDDPIVLVSYNLNDSNAGCSQALLDAAREIYRESAGGKTRTLLLGRTRYDEDLIKAAGIFESTGRDGRYRIPAAPNMEFQFLTVHKSKGLEGDYVILLNAEDSQMGFPNRIADDPVLQLVLGKPEQYEYAEERRLFYVAITRTRNKTYILHPKQNPSPFLKDIIGFGVPQPAADKESARPASCPKCGTGHLVQRESAHGSFMGCSNFPMCDYKVRTMVDSQSLRCPECGGFLVRRESNANGSVFWGCSNYPLCRHTEDVMPQQ